MSKLYATRMESVDPTIIEGKPINRIQVGNTVYPLSTTGFIGAIPASIDDLEELKKKVNKLMGKPYYLKISCHNCGAPLTIDSTNHLVKCKYCKTAYFSGTQLVNAV